MSQPNFGKGGDGAAAAAAAQSGSKFPKQQYLTLDDGQQIVARIITDSPEWIYVKQHPSVPTKNQPKNFPGKKWPSAMPAVCRHDEAFESMYTDCYVCDTPILNPRDNKPLTPAIRVWAFACLREPVIGDGSEALGGPDMKGKMLGYRDATREVAEIKDGKATDNIVIEKAIVIVNFGMKNFFAGLQAIYGIYGTVCDRDYVIKREGTELSTEYRIMPLDKIAGCEPSNTEWWSRYTDSLKEQNLDLAAIIAEKASDSYYAKFFDPRVEGWEKEAAAEGVGGDTTPAAMAADSVDPAALEAMRNRVRGFSEGIAADPTPVAAPAAAPVASGMQNFG